MRRVCRLHHCLRDESQPHASQRHALSSWSPFRSLPLGIRSIPASPQVRSDAKVGSGSVSISARPPHLPEESANEPSAKYEEKCRVSEEVTCIPTVSTFGFEPHVPKCGEQNDNDKRPARNYAKSHALSQTHAIASRVSAPIIPQTPHLKLIHYQTVSASTNLGLLPAGASRRSFQKRPRESTTDKPQ